jgi:hypothetical protein
MKDKKMKGEKPKKSRLRKAFMAVMAAVTVTFGGAGIDQVPRDHETQHQKMGSVVSPVNLSITDQFWYQTTDLKNSDVAGHELYQAASKGENWRVLTLLKEGAASYQHRMWALTPAIEKGHLDTVKIIIEQTPFDQHPQGLWSLRERTLFLGVGFNQENIVNYALSLGVDPNASDGFAMTLALANQNAMMAETLLNAGARFTPSNLDALAEMPYNAELINMVLMSSPDISWNDSVFLQKAVVAGDHTMVQAMLAMREVLLPGQSLPTLAGVLGTQLVTGQYGELVTGVDIDAGNGQALTTSILKKDYLMMEVLLMGGANINIASGLPLALAAAEENTSLMKYLIKKGARVNGAQLEAYTKIADKYEDASLKTLLDAAYRPDLKITVLGPPLID